MNAAAESEARPDSQVRPSPRPASSSPYIPGSKVYLSRLSHRKLSWHSNRMHSSCLSDSSQCPILFLSPIHRSCIRSRYLCLLKVTVSVHSSFRKLSIRRMQNGARFTHAKIMPGSLRVCGVDTPHHPHARRRTVKSATTRTSLSFSTTSAAFFSFSSNQPVSRLKLNTVPRHKHATSTHAICIRNRGLPIRDPLFWASELEMSTGTDDDAINSLATGKWDKP